jgi:hypothetical protein
MDLAGLKDRSPRWAKDVANVATRQYGRATVGGRPGPDFLIIGTKRGGTTSLFNYLLMHPGVLGLFPQNRGTKSTDYFFSSRFDRGAAWYRSHFHTETYRRRLEARLGYRPVSGEASPYYVWDPRIAERVQRDAPGVKAIMLVRDPVKRAWSHYLERQQNGVEPLSFPDALAAEEVRLAGELDRMNAEPGYHSTAWDWYCYRSRGDYLPQLQHWTSVLGRDDLLVLRSEDMYADPQVVVDQVCDFLGLPHHPLPTRRTFNAAERPSAMPEESAAELRAHFQAKVPALEAWLGRSLDWSV